MAEELKAAALKRTVLISELRSGVKASPEVAAKFKGTVGATHERVPRPPPTSYYSSSSTARISHSRPSSRFAAVVTAFATLRSKTNHSKSQSLALSFDRVRELMPVMCPDYRVTNPAALASSGSLKLLATILYPLHPQRGLLQER